MIRFMLDAFRAVSSAGFARFGHLPRGWGRKGRWPWLATLGLLALLLPSAALGQDDELLGGSTTGQLGEPSLAQGNILRVAISMGGDTSVSETITLGLGKSAIVELPIDVADALVSNPAIADAIIRTPRRIYVLGLTVGQTNAFFFNGAGEQILNLEIRVERDLAPVREMIDRLIPDSRITVQALNDNIVLSGIVSSAAESERAHQIAVRYVDVPEKVLNALTITGGEQVLLKVRVVEMQRTVVKQLGINLSGTTRFGEVRDPTTGNLIGYDGSYTIATDNEFSLAGRSLGGLGAGVSLDNTVEGILQNSLEATLSALERVGLVRTLAEPNLTAISGEAANFLAGGEFPVPVGRDSEGNIRIEYKPFGVGLSFTPVVLDDGRISLFISTEVSELTDQGALELTAGTVVDNDGNVTTIPGLTLPGLKVRRAETTLELPSGGSMVMAGLIQDVTKQSFDGVPGAKDVPGLGALFRARDLEGEETELVVIVTPYLVTPVGTGELQTPSDGYVAANDLEAVFLGRLNRVYAAPDAATDDRGWRGPIGFILDEGDAMPGRAGQPYASVATAAPVQGAQDISVDGAGESDISEGGMP